MLRIAEVFAGIGGVTGGFLDAGGYQSVFLSDIDEAARDAFLLNFPRLDGRYHVGRVERLTGPQTRSSCPESSRLERRCRLGVSARGWCLRANPSHRSSRPPCPAN